VLSNWQQLPAIFQPTEWKRIVSFVGIQLEVGVRIRVKSAVRERSFVHKGSRRLDYLTPLQLLH
jgi:hypothetical protein